MGTCAFTQRRGSPALYEYRMQVFQTASSVPFENAILIPISSFHWNQQYNQTILKFIVRLIYTYLVRWASNIPRKHRGILHAKKAMVTKRMIGEGIKLLSYWSCCSERLCFLSSQRFSMNLSWNKKHFRTWNLGENNSNTSRGAKQSDSHILLCCPEQGVPNMYSYVGQMLKHQVYKN